jgi:hypothetical protein
MKLTQIGKEVSFINSIRYDGPIMDKKYIGAPTPLLGESWKLIRLSPPAKNADIETQKELLEIEQTGRELTHESWKDINRQDVQNPQIEFINYLIDNYLEINEDRVKLINDLAGELTTVGLFFKMKFNRPRPQQILGALGRRVGKEGETTKSPSYPSTHAIIARFMDKFLVKLYPDKCKEISKIGQGMCFLRIAASYHFPSDIDAGVYLGEKLYSIFLNLNPNLAQMKPMT